MADAGFGPHGHLPSDDSLCHRPGPGDLVAVRYTLGRPPDTLSVIAVGWIIGVSDEWMLLAPTLIDGEPGGEPCFVAWSCLDDGYPQIMETPS